MRHKLKIGDIILISCMLILAVGCLLWTQDAGETVIATISIEGETTDRFVLNNLLEPIEKTYRNLGYENTIRVENGRIGVINATCPGNDCVHMGWLSAPGRQSVCLKSRLMITLSGEGRQGPDVVVR